MWELHLTWLGDSSMGLIFVPAAPPFALNTVSPEVWGCRGPVLRKRFAPDALLLSFCTPLWSELHRTEQAISQWSLGRQGNAWPLLVFRRISPFFHELSCHCFASLFPGASRFFPSLMLYTAISWCEHLKKKSLDQTEWTLTCCVT